MSYILEALKKAQAERQLGSAPTIHAAAIHAAPVSDGGAARRPLWIVLAAGVLLAGAAAWAWRGRAPAAPVVAAVVPAPVVAAPAVPVPVPVPVVVAPAAPMPVPVPTPVPVPPKPKPVIAHVAPPPAPAPAPAAAAKKTAPPVVAAVVEDPVRTLRDLPEAVQRSVPQVTFGGYMYSNNPADRLLLVDKVLRHEGEEVAPGLILEKLLPKAAVMSYKGYRYRVAY